MKKYCLLLIGLNPPEYKTTNASDALRIKMWFC